MIDRLYDLAMRAPHLRVNQILTWERELFDAASAAMSAGNPAADVYMALLDSLCRVPFDPAKARARAIADTEFQRLPPRVQRAMSEAAYASLNVDPKQPRKEKGNG